jgi:putative photosynthetic complex assembly protein 2
MGGFAAPAIYAALVWWFTTGLILLLDGLPKKTFRWSMAGATVALLAAVYGVKFSRSDPTPMGAYIGFSCAILIWGWLEMSFLMGFITGPRRSGCHERCSGWRHFIHAAQAIIYNELATLIAAAVLLAATGSSPNKVALWTFLLLWAMRLSAKLNLFLGVPNLGDKLLPAHLMHLKSFFRQRAMNFLFPLSITGSTVAVASLIGKCSAASNGFQLIAYALLISLLALAILEHWFMVLPLPSEKLWSWALKSNPASRNRPLKSAPLESPRHIST